MMYVDIYNTTHRPVQFTKVVPFGLHVIVASKLCHLRLFYAQRVFTTEVMWRRVGWQDHHEKEAGI